MAGRSGWGPTVPQLEGHEPTTLSADVYRDPPRYELERRHVLGARWLLAGRSEQIAEAGSWLTYEGHGETIVFSRQRDGSVSAFHNVCAHRGAAIVAGLAGCGARRFTCPYHGWVYDTRGSVVGVPDRDDFDPDELASAGAVAVAVAEWGGWVWINLLGPSAAPPLLDAIGEDIVGELARWRLEDMVLHDVVEYDVPVNYKAIVDGFNEVYHVTHLHHVPPEVSSAFRRATSHAVGENFMCFIPRAQSLDELAESLDHFLYGISHHIVFPNTIFNCNPDHIMVFQPIPIAVDRTRFKVWQLIHPGDLADSGYKAYHASMMDHWERLRGVVGEDVAAYEQLARTRQSSAHTRHILSVREWRIARYHQTMERLIQNESPPATRR